MRRHWRLFVMALRALFWRATAEPPAIGLRGLAVWVALEIAIAVALGYSAETRFSEYGLGLTIGETLLALGVTAMVLRPDRRIAACAALSVASTFILIVFTALLAGSSLLLAKAPQWVNVATSVVGFTLYFVWLTGAYAAVLRSFDLTMRWCGWLRAGAVMAVQLLVAVTFPSYPTFYTRGSADSQFNIWSHARTLFPSRKDAADEVRRVDGPRVELAQPALMEKALARLAPRESGETSVYALGIAGWAEQDVFIRELNGALAAIEKVLPVRERTLRLINHADTVQAHPAALHATFAAAVRGIASKMNKNEDVLLLFMTSHGSQDGIALRLPGLVNALLAPEEVADVLNDEGIKNRIVIVSACYAGVFVPPLANDNTIVLTAADDKSSSFGCSNEREWTYFGDALFNRSLRPEAGLEETFRDARKLIGDWETRDGVTPSNPQGHFGPALTEKLARIYGASRQAEAPKP